MVCHSDTLPSCLDWVDGWAAVAMVLLSNRGRWLTGSQNKTPKWSMSCDVVLQGRRVRTENDRGRLKAVIITSYFQPAVHASPCKY